MKRVINCREVLCCGICLLFVAPLSACDLMGVSIDREVDLSALYAKFREISRNKDRDGWGIALYGDASATVFKEPLPAAESALAEFLIDSKSLKAKILVAHLRAASIGQPSPRNTHPWMRELGGTEYVFAHVGGADKRLWRTTQLGRFQPLGENCAEFLFCHILGKLEEQRIETWNEQAFEQLHGVLSAVNDVQTTSHLLSDGRRLFAYSCKKKTWLSYVEREMTAVNMDNKQDTTKPRRAVGVVIARNGHNLAMPGEEWIKILPGELAVFENGKLIYSSRSNQ